MKKIILYLTIVLLVTLFCTTAYAADNDFIEQCRNDYTYILADDSVVVNGFENLWDDKSLISDEDIAEAEKYNSENEEKMYYALKLKVNYLEPFTSVRSVDQNGVESITIIPNSIIAGDASLSAICTDANYQAYSTIESADSYWYVVSIEKYDVHNDEILTAAACNSTEKYDISFQIPEKYSESTDLRLVKIADGQIAYVSDIDSNAATYTVSANGSAAYVFVGTRNKNDNAYTTEEEIVITAEPSQEPINNDNPMVNNTDENVDKGAINSGKTTAPQTGDSANSVILLLSVLFSCLVIICSRKRCKQ